MLECTTAPAGGLAAATLAFSSAAAVGDGVCDRSDCPAPATRRVELFEQDFYFCTHHWTEQVRLLRSPSPQQKAPLQLEAAVRRDVETAYAAV